MTTSPPSTWKTATLVELLESCPPGSKRLVTDKPMPKAGYNGLWLSHPELQLHCEACEGVRRWIAPEKDSYCDIGRTTTNVLMYHCTNCPGGPTQFKRFALLVSLPASGHAQVIKYGQWPPYGDPTPSRLIELIRPDLQMYLNGRRSENQGLGVGALTYYRRVVESQKDRILQAAIDVAVKAGEHPELIKELRAAQLEPQFSKAVANVKHAIPNSLMIKNENPLLLLHDALSDGLHAQDDATCLERAQTIRVVLVGFAERVSTALESETELDAAVKRLVQERAARGQLRATVQNDPNKSSDQGGQT